MAERSNAAVLKTVDGQLSGGSNPSLSAIAPTIGAFLLSKGVIMNYQSEIEDLVTKASALTNKPLILGTDFTVVHQSLGHTPQALPAGKMAVYTFLYNNVFLKIGQANCNSPARYQSHHYYNSSTNSTLAKSLMNDSSMSAIINGANITNWIRNNCERFDVIIDAKFGKYTLNFIEGLLHHQYQPKYEG